MRMRAIQSRMSVCGGGFCGTEANVSRPQTTIDCASMRGFPRVPSHQGIDMALYELFGH